MTRLLLLPIAHTTHTWGESYVPQIQISQKTVLSRALSNMTPILTGEVKLINKPFPQTNLYKSSEPRNG